jgi:uncharacterized protein with von Willebrand factor type A (vWA) domain
MSQTGPFAQQVSAALPHNGGEDEGRLVDNLMYFARTLRAAGLPVGPGKVLAAIEAVRAVGVERRDDFYWALHAIFVNRHDQKEIFDQAFAVFWRNPKILDKLRSLLLPDVRPDMPAEDREQLSRRLAEALQGERPGDEDSEGQEEEEIEVDASLTYSSKEMLREMDFEKMSTAELEAARDAIQRMRLPINLVRTRRFQPHPRGRRADLRASLRQAMRQGRDSIPLRWRRRRRRPPPLVVICDISGSMSRYSRMVLHFMHAVTNDRDRVHSFVFGTRLTNITRYLRGRDVDLALEKIGRAVLDWQGGTRIGHCLAEFNRFWSRRVLGQGAVVLFISDGLDREGAQGLAKEMERLHKSCRRLIWLNPLLRYEAYEPKSQGAKAIMPHVDEFRAVHNLESLAQLAEVLSKPISRRQEGVTAWLEAM